MPFSRSICRFAVLMTVVVLASTIPAHSQTASTSPAPSSRVETKAQKDARMAWWRQAKFGMFIHWGIYSVPAGTYDGKRIDGIGEWIMNNGKIPVATYAEYAKSFNPTRFDADAWASVAKAAGMKYIVMTAKHHDGFAMFHTGVDGYNIYDTTAFHRDPIAEMSAACKKQGIKFGVYYSQAQDWHQPGGGAYAPHWDKAQDGDYDEYLKNISVPQVRELLTKYHPAVLWFDTPVNMTPARVAPFEALLPLDPGLIVNNRLGEGFAGDTETPEQNIPGRGFPGRDWETCMTINDTWGYKSYDTNFKSATSLIHNLIDIASKGGNYLLNVGPDSTGIIPQPEVDRLAEMGRWLKTNGEAIYGVSSSPYNRVPFDGRCTVKGKSLYLSVFNWPTVGLALPGLQTKVKKATVLGTGEKLQTTITPDGTLTVSLPKTTDSIATVVKLDFATPPVVVEPVLVQHPGMDGAYHLAAATCDVNGGQHIENDPPNVGWWFDVKDTVSWNVDVPASNAGTYQVQAVYSVDNSTAGAAYKVTVDGGNTTATGSAAGTDGWGNYVTIKLDGALSLSAGRQIVRVTPTSKPSNAVMNLREIILTPSGGQ